MIFVEHTAHNKLIIQVITEGINFIFQGNGVSKGNDNSFGLGEP